MTVTHRFDGHIFTREAVRRAAPVALVGSIGFALLSLLYYDFVIDDAFIAFRYAKNLAEAHTLAWNIGDAPVEGFTSFLWVILNAIAIRLGADPVVFSKIVSAISAIAIIWILAVAAHSVSRSFALILVGAVSFSALFVFLSWQGLETSFVSLLLLVSALVSVRVGANPSAWAVSSWYCAAFLCALTRPDTVVFSAGVALGLVSLLAVRRDAQAIQRLLLLAVPWAALGLLYVAWRLRYFGYLFPNTYYVKARPTESFYQLAGTGYQFSGVEYVADFGQSVLFPYVVLLLIGLSYSSEKIREKLIAAGPVLLGCAAFAGYVLTIVPIQGFFGRFLFPIFPAFLFSTLICLAGRRDDRFELPVWPLGWTLVGLFALWSMYPIPQTLYEKEFRTQDSRVRIGLRLAGLPGTMFVEDSGAIPFYSGWKTADILGLVSEEIAHSGLSLSYLDRLNPDVVCVYVVDRYSRGQGYGERGKIIDEFLRTRNYVAVTVIHKDRNAWMYFFARNDSPLFAEVIERLRTVPGVEYGDLDELMAGETIPVYSPSAGHQQQGGRQ